MERMETEIKDFITPNSKKKKKANKETQKRKRREKARISELLSPTRMAQNREIQRARFSKTMAQPQQKEKARRKQILENWKGSPFSYFLHLLSFQQSMRHPKASNASGFFIILKR
jgi:hypothetical protein